MEEEYWDPEHEYLLEQQIREEGTKATASPPEKKQRMITANPLQPTLAAIVSDREPLLRPLRSGGGTHRASTNRTAGGQSTARSTGTGRSSGLHSHHKGDVDRALAAGSVIEGAA